MSSMKSFNMKSINAFFLNTIHLYRVFVKDRDATGTMSEEVTQYTNLSYRQPITYSHNKLRIFVPTSYSLKPIEYSLEIRIT